MPKMGHFNPTISMVLRSEVPVIVLLLLLATFITAVVTQKDDLVPDPDGRISDTISHRMKRGMWELGDNGGYVPSEISYTGSIIVFAGEPWYITCRHLSRNNTVKWTRDGVSLDQEIVIKHLEVREGETSSTLFATAAKSSDEGVYKCTSDHHQDFFRLTLYPSDPYEDSETTPDSDAGPTTKDPSSPAGEDIVSSGDSDAGWTTEDPYSPASEDIVSFDDWDSLLTIEDPYPLIDTDATSSGDSGTGWGTLNNYFQVPEYPVSPTSTEAESPRADNSICKPDANETPAWQSALESIIIKLNGIEELRSEIHALSMTLPKVTELSMQITKLIESNNALNERFMLLDIDIRTAQMQNTKLVEANVGYVRRLKVLERRARISRR